MTVEQNVLQQNCHKHQQTFLNQLREITGINDLQVLQQALKDSNGNLELAVAFLTAKNAKLPQPEEATYYQTALPNNDRYISVGSQADTNVIDLTVDDKDDLQRAIALSLEESHRTFRETGITDEEQAISRVLEASIAENKASLKRTHTEVWSDSPNPYDRKRQENCPVGLKNVGNTCWFSAVIQSLFNLLEFRRLVLNYNPPTSAQDVPRNLKAIKTEYARLVKLAQEDPPPEIDYRLQHAIVYFIQSQAPKKIIERTLLEQFADRNLSFDERCRNIMKVAQAKLEMIKPDEVNMEEYKKWHKDYRVFRETTMYILIGLELFQNKSYVEALLYLIYGYQYNKELISKGLYRGHDEELVSHYRRECFLKLNEQAAVMFESGQMEEVNNGLTLMNELVVPCLPLLLIDDIEEKDTVAVEDMRNRWCSYLGKEMESTAKYAFIANVNF
ncbi:hypothetical protein GDO86_002844 [Hymenochirus boettgeri]|uniref:ubiquitinyl hydrolase 1 n=1 Tax=Hymenochirus boettgeri TaxID=247094 RepID=A0A8T2K2P9_9PIPI|nr:hypothetical protein GDO86_002844 [Hymenochirus boettgeri]